MKQPHTVQYNYKTIYYTIHHNIRTIHTYIHIIYNAYCTYVCGNIGLNLVKSCAFVKVCCLLLYIHTQVRNGFLYGIFTEQCMLTPHMTSDALYTFQFPICPLTPLGMMNSTHTLKETHTYTYLKETRGGNTCLCQTEFFVLSSSVDVRW